MTVPDDVSDREIDLATSDETVEELLSGGADIDELIAAGVLDDEEKDTEVDEEEEAKLNAEVEAYMAQIDAEVSTLTQEEILVWFDQQHDWLVANGHRSSTWRSERGYGQLSNRTN